jgi:hypothetical protein
MNLGKLGRRCAVFGWCWGIGLSGLVQAAENPLAMPAVGTNMLRVLSPTLLELTVIGTRAPDPDGLDYLTTERFQALGLSAQDFVVRVGSQSQPVEVLGFKRRALYAPLRLRDLRVGNHFYLRLATPIPEGQTVEVGHPTGRLWSPTMRFIETANPYRWSPVIHVNQVGYMPAWPKKAMVGYYLGSLGEMPIDSAVGFRLMEVQTGAVVYQGSLRRRADVGFPAGGYQQVWEADFTAFRTPGYYSLVVPGLGASYPFAIRDETMGAFARTYALGLYHQRCGTANEYPFTRHVHGICHTAPAEIPTLAFGQVQSVLAAMSADYAEDPRHTAPQLKDVDSSLYPFVATGKVDVSGGHHDAGDYSKYTINSAALVHHLVFAADALPGVGRLDNLGLPESGDGKSDLLQEAKWEADFLARMQDLDGGFYFLVYPRDRQYEGDVLPDRGDPQVVFPKTTSATAAAVAALAQTASSPLFKQQFPAEAALYLQKAALGWDFLRRAISTHGWNGSYQKISHYGDTFGHDDEVVWAAVEMYLATGDPAYHQAVLRCYDPADPQTFRWGWWRLFEGYGCAVRSYAFAVRSGRVVPSQLDPTFLQKCEAQILAAGEDQRVWAGESAYGTSLSTWDKGYGNPGWYFSNDRGFDLSVAYLLKPRTQVLDAILSNNNYEAGCNPVNVTYLTGLGWRRQREIVHQYAQNDHRVLPPSGIPLGNVQGGFDWLHHYRKQLGALNFPLDAEPLQPYPMYDRWGDSFNLRTEFIVVNQARGLANLAFLFANSPIAQQSWRSAQPAISLQRVADVPTTFLATVSVPGWDMGAASVVWESKDRDPVFGRQVTLVPVNVGPQWVEVEVQLPDGRRVFGQTNFLATSVPTYTTQSQFKASPTPVSAEMVALYRFDGDATDATGRHPRLMPTGNAMLDDSNLAWMTAPAGKALRVQAWGDAVAVELSPASVYEADRTQSISLEAMVYVKAYAAYGVENTPLISLASGWNASLALRQDKWATDSHVCGGGRILLDSATQGNFLTPHQWHRLRITLDRTHYVVSVDDREIARQGTADLANWAPLRTPVLRLGNFDGWLDEVIVRSSKL